MGALTLKNFPFELWRWDINKFNSVDLTDSFGCNTKVYVHKNRVIQIEPSTLNFNNNWLSDKARQFFDTFSMTSQKTNNINILSIIKKIIKRIYIFDHCNKQINKIRFAVFICDNLNLETLNMLFFILKSYSFITLWAVEKWTLNNNLESDLQLNYLTPAKLNFSKLSLLICTNPRFEGYYLNLLLRQWFLKGNFKCLLIGSFINLTFPVIILGANFLIIKTIFSGNNLICQNLKLANNPILIYNQELLKQSNTAYNVLKILNKMPLFNNTWNGLNCLNAALSDCGISNLLWIPKLSFTDLNNFNILYFIQVTISSSLKKIAELKLLKLLPTKAFYLKKRLLIEHNYKSNNNFKLLNQISCNYLYLPSAAFFKDSGTFINTEGSIKWVTKLINKKKTKTSFQVLKKLIKYLTNKLYFLTKKNDILMLNFFKTFHFKNYIYFCLYPTTTLKNLNFYTNVKNKAIKIKKHNFKLKKCKIIHSKLKYWLDDFFNGGKDEYSKQSIILNKCSHNLRLNNTNFF